MRDCEITDCEMAPGCRYAEKAAAVVRASIPPLI
jgi:hypothetical protein